MARKRPLVAVRTIADKRLECGHCGHDGFWARRTLLNTVVATFLRVEAFNRAARNYICEECGHIEWFIEP